MKQLPKSCSTVFKALLLILGAGALLLVVVAGIIVVMLNRTPVAAPEKPKKIRVDIVELREYVDIDIPVAAVKWEVFGSPEDEGLWGNLDRTTVMIAEIDPGDPTWFKPRKKALEDYVSVVEESPRPWLSPHFKELMQKATKDGVISKDPRCGAYEAGMQKSGRVVDGFICAHAGKILLYLTIDVQN